MNVNGGYAAAESRDCFNGADSDMRVAKIETDADVVQMAHFKDGNQMLGRGGFAEQVFDKKANAERPGECAQMFKGGEREFNGARRPAVISFAEMNDKIAQRDMLGCLQSALDLIHRVDAAGLFRVQDIHSWRSGTTHFTIGIERCVH